MKKTISSIAIAGAIMVALAACGDKDEAPQNVPDAAANDTVEVISDEQVVREAAISIDAVFADDAVWEAAIDTAKSYCSLAYESDADTAFVAAVSLGAQSGISADRVGIIVGIATELYCPDQVPSTAGGF